MPIAIGKSQSGSNFCNFQKQGNKSAWDLFFGLLRFVMVYILGLRPLRLKIRIEVKLTTRKTVKATLRPMRSEKSFSTISCAATKNVQVDLGKKPLLLSLHFFRFPLSPVSATIEDALRSTLPYFLLIALGETGLMSWFSRWYTHKEINVRETRVWGIKIWIKSGNIDRSQIFTEFKVWIIA